MATIKIHYSSATDFNLTNVLDSYREVDSAPNNRFSYDRLYEGDHTWAYAHGWANTRGGIEFDLYIGSHSEILDLWYKKN